MASKITSTSVVTTGYSVSIPNLRQGLLEHFFESSHESEDDSSDSDVCSSFFFFFPDKSSHVSHAGHVIQGIPQCSRQVTERLTAQRYGYTRNKE